MSESTLFQGVTVYISGDPEKKVLDALKNGKGQMSKFTMEKATHVLCGKNYEESHVQEARELYEIPAVTEKWILDSLRINKLANSKAYAPGSQGKLFSNFIFTMNQIDHADRLKLYAMITLQGGTVQKVLDNKVTHLISGTAQSVALKLAGLVKMTIVTPDWVLDCLKSKRLVEADMYHPNLLVSPLKQQKIAMISTSSDLKSPSIIRNQLQQNVRPARPMVQMQHTPQQINEIIQSQIQQQQMQEQAKRAAQAQASQTTNVSAVAPIATQNTLSAQNIQTVAGGGENQQQQPPQQQILQVNQIQKVSATIQQTMQQQQQNVQQQQQPASIGNVSNSNMTAQTAVNPTNVCIIQPNQQGNVQANVAQNQIQMNVNVQQVAQVNSQAASIQQQRQISLQQQMETNARNQKIQLISQQLQQSTQNQLLAQQQQLKQFQSNQIVTTAGGSGNSVVPNIQQQQIVVNQSQQFISSVQTNVGGGGGGSGSVIGGGAGNIQVQQNQMSNQQVGQPQTQFGNQTMKQILTTGGQSQNQQFIINPNANPNLKTIGPQQTAINPQGAAGQQQQQQLQTGSGGNYVQIIQQQGQQIIQIQHPDGSSQILQKNVNQMQQQQQQQQSIQLAGGPNVAIQSSLPNSQIAQNIQAQQQPQQQAQIPSSPSTMMTQQQNPQQVQAQQTGLIQNQGGRQNIVIINQLQNPNQINQRFGAPQQSQFQKTPIGTQQIIQQKLLTNNEGIVQQQQQQQQQVGQPPQIIQVHQTTLPGGQIQQQSVENIINSQVVSTQQSQAPAPQASQTLTQAQAVQQIAQQLQSGTAEIISQQQQQQQQQAMTQGLPQVNPQMNIIQTQAAAPHQIGGASAAVNQQAQIQTRQWIPQSPTQQNPAQQAPPQTPQSPIVQQTVVQQHIITTNPQGAPGQQFIRASGQMRGPIYLDAQSTLQFQRMDQMQRQEYLEQLHNKQQQQQREGVMFQQRGTGQTPGPRTQHHIVIRSQVHPGLTPQQLQLLNNQRRQILIRQPNQVGVTQINPPGPNQHANITQIQVDPNATPQQQQLQRQQHLQRLQQLQNQKLQGTQVQTPVSPRGGQGFPAAGGAEGILEGMPQQVPQHLATPSNDANGVSSSKTKTALANMLSNRLGGNNGNVVSMVDGATGGVVEQSAAGTLRMMTAQHNALNVQGMAPGVVRNPQELIVLQQQQQQQIQSQMPGAQAIVQTHPQIQQRRTLGNITNAPTGGGVVVPTSPVIVGNQIPPQVIMPQSPSSSIKTQPPFSPGRAPQIVNRPQFQFYGHNPNLKLPSELFLLGCHFLIVEYDETDGEDLNDWKVSIKHHGGEIEACYNLKVTHVLCRTQKHGIVMQAIRDNKRCVTAYWLNDIILKKQVIPPWQAIHFPSSAVFGSLKPGMKHIVSIMGFEGDERERVKRMIEESGAKLTTYLNKQNTVLVCKRLDQTNRKFLHAKESNIPMVNVVWLSDLLLGNTSMISQFESPKYQQFNLPQPLRIDHSILPQLMNAWKAPINLTQEAHERLKRSQLEPPTKRAKKMRTIPPLESIPNEIGCIRQPTEIPVVMFSHVDYIEGLVRTVSILGGRVTDDINEMTHLVMTKPNRTIKFLNALCTAKYIISSAWLEDSAKAGCFQLEDNYWINDLSKANFKCDIPAVVRSPTRSRLFENRVFYITPSVKPAPSYLRWLIEKSGGKWEHNRRSVMKIHELNQQSPNSYIVVSCPEDLHLLGFKHYVCYVCTSEFILQAIMTQTMDFLKSELQLSR